MEALVRLSAPLLVLSACAPPIIPAAPQRAPSVEHVSLDALPLPPRAIAPLPERVHAPPPLFGSTLLITHDRTRAVVSDPDSDRVFVVDLVTPLRLVASLALTEGDEPGMAAEDATGHVHVLLRRSGAVVTLDPQAGTIRERRQVCDAPRGIAFDPRGSGGNRMLVACGGGALLALDGADRATVDTFGSDLRDVVLDAAGHPYVTHFRSATLVDAASKEATRPEETVLAIPEMFRPSTASYAAAVAWRTLASGDGSVFMLHQRHSQRDLDGMAYLYYGMNANTPDFSVVKPTITRFDRGVVQEEILLSGEILPVDLALSSSPSGFPLAVAFASSHTVEVVRRNEAPLRISSRFGLRHPVGVAWSDDTLFVQYQDPPALVGFSVNGDERPEIASVMRFGEPRAEAHRGHEIFHMGTQTGVACASCHPEASDDGHTWTFFSRAVRTPALRGGLSGTAPFHWNGEHASMDSLVAAVMRVRMGGPELEQDNVRALEGWLDQQDSLPGQVDDAEAIERGRAVFAGAAQCAGCHGGRHLTDNASHDVGTGGRFQTPSLRGLRWRAPYLHDGCAPTLEARLGECHTAGHGVVSTLDDAERRDLLTYLESL